MTMIILRPVLLGIGAYVGFSLLAAALFVVFVYSLVNNGPINRVMMRLCRVPVASVQSARQNWLVAMRPARSNRLFYMKLFGRIGFKWPMVFTQALSSSPWTEERP